MTRREATPIASLRIASQALERSEMVPLGAALGIARSKSPAFDLGQPLLIPLCQIAWEIDAATGAERVKKFQQGELIERHRRAVLQVGSRWNTPRTSCQRPTPSWRYRFGNRHS